MNISTFAEVGRTKNGLRFSIIKGLTEHVAERSFLNLS